MLNKHRLFSTLFLVGLLFGSSGNITAQINSDMSSHATSSGAFRRLEQPLELKIGVTTGGLGLIGLEIWWFLLSKPKSQLVQTQQGIQEVSITDSADEEHVG